MSKSYYGIYLHIVFAVKDRICLISPVHEENIHSYIAGIIRNKGHVPMKVGGVDNHVHILLSYNPAKELIPNLVKDIKVASTSYINGERMTKCLFGWQKGYACLSVSYTHVKPLMAYIESQHEHHYGCTLDEEIKRLLERSGVEYDSNYLFDDA